MEALRLAGESFEAWMLAFMDDLAGSATLSLEEGIVGQCVVSHDDGGGRSRKGWVGLADGGIKKIGWIVMNDR